MGSWNFTLRRKALSGALCWWEKHSPLRLLPRSIMALCTEVTLSSLASGRPDEGAKHWCNQEVGLFKKKKSVFEVLSA